MKEILVPKNKFATFQKLLLRDVTDSGRKTPFFYVITCLKGTSYKFKSEKLFTKYFEALIIKMFYSTNILIKIE